MSKNIHERLEISLEKKYFFDEWQLWNQICLVVLSCDRKHQIKPETIKKLIISLSFFGSHCFYLSNMTHHVSKVHKRDLISHRHHNNDRFLMHDVTFAIFSLYWTVEMHFECSETYNFLARDVEMEHTNAVGHKFNGKIKSWPLLVACCSRLAENSVESLRIACRRWSDTLTFRTILTVQSVLVLHSWHKRHEMCNTEK